MNLPPISLYNTLTRSKTTLRNATVATPLTMYVCGPTVYDRLHIGNARAYVIYRLFARYLEMRDIPHQHVSNITDINNKIDRRAQEEGVSSEDWAKKAEAWYREDTNALGLGRPDNEPRASEHMDSMIGMIEGLVDKGYAYVTTKGDVYFRANHADEVGALSGRVHHHGHEFGRDNIIDNGKEDAADFALWKSGHEAPLWPSPWGEGRPGWHLECSVMAHDLLGSHFDIHGGGLDLIFPHHEAERAQSKAFGDQHADVWWHSGMLTVNGEKGSKTAQNLPTLQQALQTYSPQALIMFLMQAHPRKPLGWTQSGLIASQEALRRLQDAYQPPTGYVDQDAIDAYLLPLHEALSDDFNLPVALAHLFSMAAQMDVSHVHIHAYHQALNLFGLIPEAIVIPQNIQDLAKKREKARADKAWDVSDAMRVEMANLGWQAKDTADGTVIVPLEK